MSHEHCRVEDVENLARFPFAKLQLPSRVVLCRDMEQFALSQWRLHRQRLRSSTVLNVKAAP